MFANIKMWVYSVVTFIILTLTVWLKVVKEKNERLEKESKSKDIVIKQTEKEVQEIKDVREEEARQRDIVEISESKKESIKNKVSEMIKNSTERDVEVGL